MERLGLISGILKTRNGKQIRDRFINVLDPKIAKKKFSDEEVKLLMKLYMLHGAKWAMIAKKFKERTPDMIKNCSMEKDQGPVEDKKRRSSDLK